MDEKERKELKEIVKRVSKKAEEHTRIMEYLVEFEGHCADVFIVGYINYLERYSKKMYNLQLKHMKRWFKNGKPKIPEDVKKAFEKRSQYLIKEK